MTTSRNISNDLLERELAGLTASAGESPEPGLWAAALNQTSRAHTKGPTLTRKIPVWASYTFLGLILVAVVVNFRAFSSSELQGWPTETPTANWSVADQARSAPPASPAARASSGEAFDSIEGSYQAAGTRASVPDLAVRRESEAGKPSPTAERRASSDRQVIRKAQIDIRTTDNVRIAFMKAQQVISEAGGEYIENAALTGEGDRMVATVTLRVAAARLSEVLNRLRELGIVASESASGEDVTDRVVDLEARLRNEQRIESEMLELLESRKDASLEEILQLRTQLANVRERIEQFTAQRDRLGRLVVLATILVSIQPAAAPAVAEEPAKFSIAAYFSDSITRSWNNSLRTLVDTAAFFVRMLVGGIVWWVLLLVIVLGLRAAWQSHRRAAAAEPAPIS